jgi:cardiolipin synthase (CMP-forming)
MNALIANLKLIPNQITAVRFILIPVMWILALGGFSGYLGIGLIICLVSDALDGYLARRLKQSSEFGAKFDSLADNLLIPSALLWLLVIKPTALQEHPVMSVLAVATYLSSLTVGWIKFKQFGNLHLYLSKVSGLAQYIFIIHTFISRQYNPWLFYLTISLFFLSSLETLLMQIICPAVNQRLGLILFVLHILDQSDIFTLKPVYRNSRPTLVSMILRSINGFVRLIYGGSIPAPEYVNLRLRVH